MARLLKSTILDRFYDEFLEMDEAEQRVTIGQLEGMIRASKHQREKAAEWGKKFEAAAKTESPSDWTDKVGDDASAELLKDLPPFS